ncbi:MAG: hypothetical protein AVDCRST_MAG77-4228, partial [uncultured Chloroflexi bacterium]
WACAVLGARPAWTPRLPASVREPAAGQSTIVCHQRSAVPHGSN